MPIPEDQFDTWAKQGAVAGSRDTYASIKGVLEDEEAPYAGKSINVFLQGSYGNDTNVWAESDVDIVCRLDSVYYYDLSQVDDEAKARFKRDHGDAEYTYKEFKAHVVEWLAENYGAASVPGTKAVTIEGDGNRRNADVLPCVKMRRYSRYINSNDETYIEGIRFWRTDGTEINNYPKQHSENCTQKHKDTAVWFKPTVRILKNIRNKMVEAGEFEKSLAPSYFIEGMLWNVPPDKFGTSYADTFAAAINWLMKADKTKLVTASQRHYLLRNNSPVCWNEADFDKFLEVCVKWWNDW